MKVPKEFDTKPQSFAVNLKDIPEDERPDANVLEKIRLPICIKNMLSDRRLINDKRFWVLVYLRDIGVSMEEATQILATHLDPDYAYDSITVEKQPERVFRMKQRQTLMKDCHFMSTVAGCVDECTKCHRYAKRHPIYR
jgi:DNA primase large subunit